MLLLITKLTFSDLNSCTITQWHTRKLMDKLSRITIIIITAVTIVIVSNITITRQIWHQSLTAVKGVPLKKLPPLFRSALPVATAPSQSKSFITIAILTITIAIRTTIMCNLPGATLGSQCTAHVCESVVRKVSGCLRYTLFVFQLFLKNIKYSACILSMKK